MEDGEKVALTIQPLARFRVFMVRVLNDILENSVFLEFLAKFKHVYVHLRPYCAYEQSHCLGLEEKDYSFFTLVFWVHAKAVVVGFMMRLRL